MPFREARASEGLQSSQINMSEQVTKSKNEGRVAAGKRLVEWNRKNKENLVKNREQVASSGDSSNLASAPSDQQEPQSQTSTVFYGGGALVVLAVIGVALYHVKKPAPPKALSNNDDDIFCMN